MYVYVRIRSLTARKKRSKQFGFQVWVSPFRIAKKQNHTHEAVARPFKRYIHIATLSSTARYMLELHTPVSRLASCWGQTHEEWLDKGVEMSENICRKTERRIGEMTSGEVQRYRRTVYTVNILATYGYWLLAAS